MFGARAQTGSLYRAGTGLLKVQLSIGRVEDPFFLMCSASLRLFECRIKLCLAFVVRRRCREHFPAFLPSALLQ